MTLKKIIEIQKALKAPKGQTNSFGNYKFRSLEDIETALKPLLYEHKVALFFNDEVVLIGERYYVKATVSVFDEDGTLIISGNGLARESEIKKGMDSSQITGSSSSYARKYAIAGVFLVDDTKDADTQDNTKPTNTTPPKATPPKKTTPPVKITEKQSFEIEDLILVAEVEPHKITELYQVDSILDMTKDQYDKCKKKLNVTIKSKIKEEEVTINEMTLKTIKLLIDSIGLLKKDVLTDYDVKDLKDLSVSQGNECIERLNKKKVGKK